MYARKLVTLNCPFCKTPMFEGELCGGDLIAELPNRLHSLNGNEALKENSLIIQRCASCKQDSNLIYMVREIFKDELGDAEISDYGWAGWL